MYPPMPSSQYGGGQLYYHNNFGGAAVKAYQQPAQSLHYYRGRGDGVAGRPTARRNSRSQQQAAYDFYHYAPHAQQQPLYAHQKPPLDHVGGESDNVIGIKYDQDKNGPSAGKHHQPSPPFRPSHPVWASQYPVPWTYYVKSSMVQPRQQQQQQQQQYGGAGSRKSRYVQLLQTGAASNRVGGGHAPAAKPPPRTKVVYIEYGGFKPKMVPSVQINAAEEVDGNRRQSVVEDAAVGDTETVVQTVARPDAAGDVGPDAAERRDGPTAAAAADTTVASVTATAATTTTTAAASSSPAPATNTSRQAATDEV